MTKGIIKMNTKWMKKNIGLIFIVVLFYGVSSIASAGLFNRGVVLNYYAHTFTWGDADFDGIRNDVDPDDDNDGVPDKKDAFPYNRKESVDTDGDGIGNNADKDDDNDGVPDKKDAFPLDPSASKSFRYCLNQVLTPRAANNKSIFKYFVRTDPRCGFSQKEPDQSKVMPLGTDSDRDGVRDDVQEKIKAKFGKSTAVTNYTMDMAKSFQKVLSGALSHRQVNQQVAQINHLHTCIRNTTNDPEAGGQFILMAQLNTVDRIRKYLKAAAEAFDAEGPPEEKPCDKKARSFNATKVLVANASPKGGGVAKTRSKSSSAFTPRVNPPNLRGYDVIFINGVRTDDEKAGKGEERLEEILGANTVQLEWNKNHFAVQHFDLWVHKRGEIEVDKTGGRGFWQIVGEWLFPPSPIYAPQFTPKDLYTLYTDSPDIGIWAKKDLARMIKTAKNALTKNKKVIIVAHSEGNFFYRNIHKALNQWNSTKTKQCFAGIGFAPLLSSKPGNYNYITSKNDEHINMARKLWPNILKSNVSVPSNYGDYFGHGLLKTYLSHPIPLQLFQKKIKEAVNRLDKSCKTKRPEPLFKSYYSDPRVNPNSGFSYQYSLSEIPVGTKLFIAHEFPYYNSRFKVFTKEKLIVDSYHVDRYSGSKFIGTGWLVDYNPKVHGTKLKIYALTSYNWGTTFYGGSFCIDYEEGFCGDKWVSENYKYAFIDSKYWTCSNHKINGKPVDKKGSYSTSYGAMDYYSADCSCTMRSTGGYLYKCDASYGSPLLNTQKGSKCPMYFHTYSHYGAEYKKACGLADKSGIEIYHNQDYRD